LARLSRRIGDWQGYDAPPLDAKVLAVLGADDYVNRAYRKGVTTLGLYVGYHNAQRQDDSIHSPLNCLPGAGWTVTKNERITIRDSRSPAGRVVVNRLIVEKGEQRQAALYWYQSRGAVIASEYESKARLFLSAVRSGRSDAALVRIMWPVMDNAPEASAEAAEFASELLPALGRHVPE
jgi:EpsI family protein